MPTQLDHIERELLSLSRQLTTISQQLSALTTGHVGTPLESYTETPLVLMVSPEAIPGLIAPAIMACFNLPPTTRVDSVTLSGNSLTYKLTSGLPSSYGSNPAGNLGQAVRHE